MKTRKQYIIKSKLNPSMTLCTNGEMLPDGFFGPGHSVGAKVYKTLAGARRAVKTSQIIHNL